MAERAGYRPLHHGLVKANGTMEMLGSAAGQQGSRAGQSSVG